MIVEMNVNGFLDFMVGVPYFKNESVLSPSLSNPTINLWPKFNFVLFIKSDSGRKPIF